MSCETYHPRGELVDGYAAQEHPLYTVWAKMKDRCNNPNDPGYHNYGGRGITYCDRWKHFKNFAEDMGLRPSPNHSIDRIDNDGNYEPSNCRWATRVVQMHNRRVFKNNKTGVTGVQKKRNGRYIVRFQYEGERYQAGGSFATVEEAKAARDRLVRRVELGEDVNDLLERPARHDSATGIKGITPHQDGRGYLVRVTHKGVRKYLGYFTDFEKAKEAREAWVAEQK